MLQTKGTSDDRVLSKFYSTRHPSAMIGLLTVTASGNTVKVTQHAVIALSYTSYLELSTLIALGNTVTVQVTQHKGAIY
jgi:hypothetical protein